MIDYLLSLSNKEWHKTIYYYSSFISIFLIIIAYTGIIYINPNYIRRLHTFILFYVCAILLIRFNPYAKGGHSDFDKKIVTFTPPITLENFKISFYKYDNTYYNFNNREHMLTFEIDVADYDPSYRY